MKRLLFLLALLPSLAYSQLPAGDPLRVNAVETLYTQARYWESAVTNIDVDINLVNNLANRGGYCGIFLGDAYCTTPGNAVSLTNPQQITWTLESQFTAAITATANTMSDFTVSGGNLVFFDSVWRTITGNADLVGQLLSLVGAAPGAAGSDTTIPTDQDGLLRVDVASNNTIWGTGLTTTDPAVTAPTAVNVNYYAELGVDGCVDVYLSNVLQQENAVCGVANVDRIGLEIDQTGQEVTFLHEGQIFHTIDNGGAFSALYAAAVITTTDSDAVDDAIFDTDLQVLTSANNITMWSNTVTATVNGLDLEDDSLTSSTSSARSTVDILEGDSMVASSVTDTYNTGILFGLAPSGAVGAAANFDFNFEWLDDNTVEIRESDTLRQTPADFTIGEKYTISMDRDGVVTYSNVTGGLLYTSLVAPTFPMEVHVLLSNATGGTDDIIRNAHLDVIRLNTADIDFEGNNFTGMQISTALEGNTATIVTTPAPRSGTYAMSSVVDRVLSTVTNRTEATLEDPDLANRLEEAHFGYEYWYGFSVYLPAGFEVCDCEWDVIAQWHGTADSYTTEVERDAPLALDVSTGNWVFTTRSDSKKLTNISGANIYDTDVDLDLGPVASDLDSWVDFIVRAKWDWTAGGELEIWKDGDRVVSRLGVANAYNDNIGPYFKVGQFLDPAWITGDAVNDEREVFHDEIRVTTSYFDEDDFIQLNNNNSEFSTLTEIQVLDEQIQMDPNSVIDAYAVTPTSIATANDGELSLTLLEANKALSFGLSNDVTPAVATDLDYRFEFLADGTVDTYAGVTSTGTNVTSATAGSVYQIVKDESAGEILFYKDAGLVDTITGETFSTTLSGVVYIESESRDFLAEGSVWNNDALAYLAPGGFMFDKGEASVGRMNLATVQGLIPGTGGGIDTFTNPAPYSTEAVLLSDGDAATWEYSYWNKMCLAKPDGSRYVMIPRLAGAEIITFNEDTGAIANVAGLTNLPADIGGDWECHPTDPDKFFYRNGTSMAEFDMNTNTATNIWDVAASVAGAPHFLTVTGLWQRSNSKDADLHVVSYRTGGTFEDQGCIAWRESNGNVFVYTKIASGIFDECQAGAVDYLIVKDDPAAGGPQHNNYIYDLGPADWSSITEKFVLLDVDGAGGHSDVFKTEGPGAYEGFISADNNNGSFCNTVRHWNFTDNADTAALLANSGEALLEQGNCSEEAPEHIAVDRDGRFWCGTSENDADSQRISNGIFCGTFNELDTQFLAVAAMPSINVAGDSYQTAMKGALSRDGDWIIGGANFGDTSPNLIRIWATRVPHHLLTGPAPNNSTVWLDGDLTNVTIVNLQLENDTASADAEADAFMVLGDNAQIEYTITSLIDHSVGFIDTANTGTVTFANMVTHVRLNTSDQLDFYVANVLDTANISGGAITVPYDVTITIDDVNDEILVESGVTQLHQEVGDPATTALVAAYIGSEAGETINNTIYDNSFTISGGGGLTDIDWTGETGGAVDDGGGDLSCTGSCNPAGAYSTASFSTPGPASLKFTVVNTTDIYAVGFDNAPTGHSNSIDYYWSITGGAAAEIRASGTYLDESGIANNDVFWIDCDNTQCRFYRNDTLEHTETTTVTWPIQVDATFAAEDTITDVQATDALKP